VLAARPYSRPGEEWNDSGIDIRAAGEVCGSAVSDFSEMGAEGENQLSRSYYLRRRAAVGPPGRGQRKKLRPSRRPVTFRKHPRGRVVHVRQHSVPSWFTPQGVHAKLKLLEAKGLPDFGGQRFLTLTVNQKNFPDDPKTAFLVCRENIRRFMTKCRDAGLWTKSSKWCWKLEFHANGWPHWHMIVFRKKKFTYSEMRKLTELWGFGEVHCRRIAKSEKFGYLFKYVFKGVYMEDGDTSLSVPTWFLDHFQPGGGEIKPESFARVRFWQTCKGFYVDPAPKVETAEPQSSFIPRPVREIVEERERAWVVCARDCAGNYRKSTLVTFEIPYTDFVRLHLWDVENGAALVLGVSSFIVALDTLDRITNSRQKWTLQPTLERNRLSLASADSLRRQRKDLLRF